MNLITDLHIHSHYSRATSKNCTLEGLYKWGKIKGINIIGTGDFTHPDWFKEISEKLEPAEAGLYRLRENIASEIDKELPESVKNNLIRFILTVEISNIYSKGGKVRKLHNLVIAPNFETATQINSQLSTIGNLKSDGRPILGLDSKELLRITLETNPENLFIPAHIWTPWFGMFGSKSGFDSIAETFEELTPEIKAIETGLSSDPYMNWQVDELKNITITSHSDAHSPQKLGREATIINSELNYAGIIGAIKTNDERLVGTIEFFPQEGKYHHDGHRACGICFTATETKQHNGKCPVCHKTLTVGVEYRINELANHSSQFKPTRMKSVEYIIPLIEIIAEVKGKGVTSKLVLAEYEHIYNTLGNEFDILRTLPTQEIKSSGFIELAYAIEKMRKGDVHIEPGYDGVYGKVSVFDNAQEKNQSSDQMKLELM